MRKYIGIFRTRFIAGLQYRAAAWAGVATQIAFGFMYLMIYRAFYESSPAAAPMDFSALASYVWLQQAFLSLTMLWRQDNDLLSSIKSGAAAYELARPYSIYPVWAARLFALRLSSAALRFLPVLIIAALLPAPWKLSAPSGAASFALFVLSMALGTSLNVALSMFVYILTFVMLSPAGARLVITAASDFLAGGLVAIPLMPDWLQRLVYCFPFHYLADFPFRVYSGHIPVPQALAGILVQAAWLVGLVALGAFSMRAVLRRAVIQGG